MNKRAQDWQGDIKLDIQSLLNKADNAFISKTSNDFQKISTKYYSMLQDHLERKHAYTLKITPPCFIACEKNEYGRFNSVSYSAKNSIKDLANKVCSDHITLKTCDICGKQYRYCELHGETEEHDCSPGNHDDEPTDMDEGESIVIVEGYDTGYTDDPDANLSDDLSDILSSYDDYNGRSNTISGNVRAPDFSNMLYPDSYTILATWKVNKGSSISYDDLPPNATSPNFWTGWSNDEHQDMEAIGSHFTKWDRPLSELSNIQDDFVRIKAKYDYDFPVEIVSPVGKGDYYAPYNHLVSSSVEAIKDTGTYAKLSTYFDFLPFGKTLINSKNPISSTVKSFVKRIVRNDTMDGSNTPILNVDTSNTLTMAIRGNFKNVETSSDYDVFRQQILSATSLSNLENWDFELSTKSSYRMKIIPKYEMFKEFVYNTPATFENDNINWIHFYDERALLIDYIQAGKRIKDAIVFNTGNPDNCTESYYNALEPYTNSRQWHALMDLTNNPDVGYITADISSYSPAAIFVRTIPPSGFNDSAVVDPMLNGDVIIEPDIEKCGASIDCYYVSSIDGEYDLSSANFIKRIYSTIHFGRYSCRTLF